MKMKSKIVLLLLTNVCVIFSQFNFKVETTPDLPKFNKIVILQNDKETLKGGILGINSTIINGELKNGKSYKCNLSSNSPYSIFFLDTIANGYYPNYILKYKVKSGSTLKFHKNEIIIYQPGLPVSDNTHNSIPLPRCLTCYNAQIGISNKSNSAIFAYGYKCNTEFTWSTNMRILGDNDMFNEDLIRFCNTDIDSVNFIFKTNTAGVFKEILVKNVKPYQKPLFTFKTINGQLVVKLSYLSNMGKLDAIAASWREERQQLAVEYVETVPEPLIGDKLELVVDEKAKPSADIQKFVLENFNKELRKKIDSSFTNAKLIVSLIIEKTGKVSETKIIDIKKIDIDPYNGTTLGFVTELTRVIEAYNTANPWIPARKNGTSVKSKYKFDIILNKFDVILK